MKAIGTIAYVTKGLYDPSVTYKEMEVVLYNGSLWEPKKETTGNAPPETQQNEDGTPASNEWWKLFLPGALGDDYVKKTDIAQASTETSEGKLGVSKPDGKTITIDTDGTLHGASLDFAGTAAELKAAITAGSVTAGMTAFIKDGEIDGDGMLVEVAEGSGMSMIGKVENGEFVPYASMGDKQLGVPLFVFDNEAEWQAEYDAGNVPDGSVIILLEDDSDPVYGTVDAELSETSEKPVQNKAIAREFENVKAMRGSDAEYGMVKLSAASDVTESTGLAVPTSELNAAVEGTLAHEISSLKDNFANKFYQYTKYDLSGMLKNTRWFTATYLSTASDPNISLNLATALPAPFNDRNKCIIIAASCFDGASWFHGAPRTTFSNHDVSIYIENIEYPQNLLLTITLMRTDI